MFLLISHVCFKQSLFTKNVYGSVYFKKTGLSVMLLMASLMVHAGTPEATGKSATNAQLASPLQKTQKRDGDVQGFNSPHWPQYRQSNKGIIPPPPPGPYISSALKDYSVRAPVFGHYVTKHVPRLPAGHHDVSRPIDMYSPDIPWPKNLRPESRMSDHRVTGKRPYYSKPSAHGKSPYATAPAKNSGYHNDRNRPQSYSNGMNMNNSRWLPGMRKAPSVPYDNRLNYAPNYGSNYDSHYNRPMINNNSVKPANHAYH